MTNIVFNAVDMGMGAPSYADDGERGKYVPYFPVLRKVHEASGGWV